MRRPQGHGRRVMTRRLYEGGRAGCRCLPLNCRVPPARKQGGLMLNAKRGFFGKNAMSEESTGNQ